MRVGIDFGTTNSGIAIYDGSNMHLFKVDNFLPDLLPSIIYITKQFVEHVGSEAREIYLRQNVNRPSRFEKIWVGELELWVSTHTSPKKVRLDTYAWNDVLAPGRLLKSVKTALRSEDYEGTRIFGEYYSLEQLIGIILKHLISCVELTLGKRITAVVIGRPVKFSEDETVDKRAQALILAGARLAGFEDIRFLPEPIAAAYTFHKKLSRRRAALIFDFGGGTLDLTVAQLGGREEPSILATEGVLIGGDDFDRGLFEYLLPHFGLGSTVAGGKPIPGYIWDVVLHWEASEGQQMADVIEFVKDAARVGNCSNPQALRALEQLLTQNLQYKLLQEIVRAKIELSNQESTVIRFAEGEIALVETVQRPQFEALIQSEVNTIAAALDRVVERAGWQHEDVELVINTGGSSQIPIFSELLARRFPAATISSEAESILTGVVQGLAIMGHDLDEKQHSQITPVKRTLVKRAKTADPHIANGVADKREEVSHFVVGVTADGTVHAHPWSAGESEWPMQPAYWQQHPMVQGLLCSRSAELLLGTLWSKFLCAPAHEISDLTVAGAKTPRYLKLAEEIGDRYVLLAKWAQLRGAELLLLVTRNGNVRFFHRSFIEEQLSRYNQWRLEMGAKPDIPASLLAVDRMDEVLLLSESGRAIRVPVGAISVRGQRAIRLKQPQIVHALRTNEERQVLVISKVGSVARCAIEDIPVAARLGGAGKQIVRHGDVCALLSDSGQRPLFGLTSFGRIVELDPSALTSPGSKSVVVALESQEVLVNCWTAQRY